MLAGDFARGGVFVVVVVMYCDPAMVSTPPPFSFHYGRSVIL
jgi:hypothetical protein